MAGELGRTTTDLENDLLENGPEYDYFQAVRMIGLLGNHKRLEEGGGQDYKLRIRPELSFNYPTSDIAEIERLEEEPGFSITTTFLGLYGVSSPLPAFVTEELLDDEWEDDEAARGFLDVIHQHIYPLLYRAWVKYKFSHNAVEHGDENYWNILYNLIGLGSEDIRAGISQPEQLLRYVGLLTEQRRSAVGLQTILEDLLSPLSVEIEPCVERTVTIPEEQRVRLGQRHCELGESAVLGMQVNDRTGKVVVRIGPLDREQYTALVADQMQLGLVRDIIKMYLLQPLDYEISLSLAPDTVTGVCLGEPMWSCLGKDSWLFSNGNTETVQMSVSR
jgi:type VI secretion system protein ImpH